MPSSWIFILITLLLVSPSALAQAFITEDFSSPTPGGWTITTDPSGVVELADSGVLSGYETAGTAWASRRTGGSGASNITNVIERTFDTTGQTNVQWVLSAAQHGGSWEGTEGLLVEIDTGDGFIEAFSDTGLLNNPSVPGDSGNGTGAGGAVLISGAGVDNGSFSLRISLTSGFHTSSGENPGGTSEIWYLDNLDISTGLVLPLKATIDRTTREITLLNPSTATGSSVDFVGYSFTSASGALDPSSWSSISDTYDVNGSGSPTISSDDWSELTDPSSFGDLSEFDFESSDGATLMAGQSISLGAAWTAIPNEDVVLEYVLSDGTLVVADVEFINGSTPVSGDFDNDGDIDAIDWNTLRSNLWGDFPDETIAQAYLRGDMDGDLAVGANDFIAFRTAYESTNPGSSFAELIAVPEPAAAVSLLCGAVVAWLVRARQRVALLACLLLVTCSPRTLEAAISAVDSVTLDGGAAGALTSVTIGGSTFNGPFAIADIGQHYSDGVAPIASFPFSAGVAPPDGLLISSGSTEGRALDNEVTSWIAGAATPGQTAGILQLRWGQGLTDVNGGDPDFFVFELGGNDSVEVQAILADGMLGQAIDLTGAWSSTAVADSLDPSSGQGVFGSSFAITDLLDAAGSPLAPGSTILGLALGDENAADFSEVYASGMITALPDPLTMQVDPVDGDVRLINGNLSGDAIAFDLYEINSLLNELDPNGWDSLEDQNLAAFPGGSGAGDGWEAGGLADTSTLGEAYLLGDSSLSPGESIYLGQAVADDVTQSDNLSWQYHLAGGGGLLTTGLIEFVSVEAPAGVIGDYNGNGVVDAADYTVWRDNLGQSVTLPNDTTPGTVTQADYTVWASNYGATSASSALTVPEPNSLLLILMTMLSGACWRCRRRALVPGVVSLTLTAVPAMATSLDREYELGDDTGGGGENAVIGAVVSQTFDETAPFIDFSISGGDPRYASVAGRPGAIAEASVIGVDFDGDGDYLSALRLGNPETSRGAVGSSAGAPFGNALNYTGIRNRAMQMWVRPSSVGSGNRQQVLADTQQFGVLISDDSEGSPTWLLDSADALVDSGVQVAFDDWTHIAVTRRFGTGTVLYLNGVAVAATSSTYDTANTSNLVLGANTDGDEFGFTGGTTDYYTGLADQLELLVWGTSATGPGGEAATDFGDFFYENASENFATNHGLARLPLADGGLGDVYGDLDGSGDLGQGDIDALVSGWLSTNLLQNASGVNIQVPDMLSYAAGDLDFDGDTDLRDAYLLHAVLVGAGQQGLDIDALVRGIPEPASCVSLAFGLAATGAQRRRLRRSRAHELHMIRTES